MPAVGFTKPGHPGKLSFEEAPEWYAKHTEVPAEAIALLAKLEQDARRFGLGLSPSGADENTTCIRQLAIKKFLDYLINGVKEWQATEGTIWHNAFENVAGKLTYGWYREAVFPDSLIHYGGYVGPSVLKRPEIWPEWLQRDPLSGSYEIELFPGLWMNGKIDKVKEDFSQIEDFKTKAWSGYKDRKTGMWKIKHYPPEMGHKIQLNLYRRAVEVCTGINPEKLTIRRMYRGARDPEQAWKKYDIPVMSNDELEARIRPHVERGQEAFAALRQIVIDNPKASKKELQALLIEGIKTLPLDGRDKRMLRDTKCNLYCTQQPICFQLAGLVGFDDEPQNLLEING